LNTAQPLFLGMGLTLEISYVSESKKNKQIILHVELAKLECSLYEMELQITLVLVPMVILS
jgi:hypothetical protein